jgi:hypothetical protein
MVPCLFEELITTRNAVLTLVEGFQALDEEAEKFFRSMDFRFLFDLTTAGFPYRL